MIRWKTSFLIMAMANLLALPSFGQDEKPAAKRPPARPVQKTSPADANKETPKPTPPKDAPRPKPATATTTAEASATPTQATVEMIMTEAVKNIAKRYNLNDAQKQKTDEIMKRDVNKFLKEHEAQVWPIIRDLMANGFNPPSNPEDIKRIGKAATPLIKDVQKAILDGNKEWRQYLTPEQQKMHDFDLNEMDKQFVEAEKNFKSWSEGKASGSLFPPPPPPGRGPATPARPSGGLPRPPAPPPEPEVQVFRESAIDTYVEDFIKQYELDPAQIDAAQSIFTEFKQKAGAYKESNRAEFSKVANEQKAAMDSSDRERIAKWESDRKKLLEPVYDLFVELGERLKALLTSSQLERFAARQPVAPKLDVLDEVAPAPAPASQAPPPPPPAAAKENPGNAPAQKPEVPGTAPQP